MSLHYKRSCSVYGVTCLLVAQGFILFYCNEGSMTPIKRNDWHFWITLDQLTEQYRCLDKPLQSMHYDSYLAKSFVVIYDLSSAFLYILGINDTLSWKGDIPLDPTMMTSSNGNIFFVTGPLCGEFTSDRSFDISFDLCLNKRLSKHPWGW